MTLPAGQAPEGTPNEPAPGEATPPVHAGSPQAAGQVPGEQPSNTPGGITDLEAANKVIADLRAENAKHRTEKKELKSQFDALAERFSKLEGGLKTAMGIGGSEGDLTPEQTVAELQKSNEALTLENTIRDIAWQSGVSTEQYDYFSFLINKELGVLGEGQELPEEVLAEIVAKAKGTGAAASGSTSVGGVPQQGASATPVPAGAASSDVPSVEEFAKMGLGEKSVLYNKLNNSGRGSVYDQLWKDSAKLRSGR